MSKTAEPILHDQCLLGEGALWHEPEQLLYWVDIMSCKVFAYDPATGENRAWNTPSPVGTVVTRKSGGLMLALKNGFASLDLDTGDVKLIKEIIEPDNRFNDGKCDPGGRFWAGTIGEDAALYRLDPDMSVRKVFGGVGCSNGIVWTDDRKTMYYIDTFAGNIRAWDYDDATGDIANERVVVTVSEDLGHPDGMAIDVDGNLWVAMYNGEGVRCFDPRAGKDIDYIACPGSPRTTSCAFGGKDRKTLFITSATEGMTDEEKASLPRAGNLFRAEAPVAGQLPHAFAG